MVKKGNLEGRFGIKDWLLSLLIALPILLFYGPMINLGCDNVNMIQHFDRDESLLIEFAGRTYSQGLIPLESRIGYPQVFYYSAGIFLFPYTIFKGIDHHMITVVLRGFNLLIAFSLVIFIYFFALRFFKSRFVAFLSSLLLGTTPQILWWAINSRPHLLSVFFMLIAVYYCFKLVERNQKHPMVLAVLFIGLATATNMFGIFLIPSLCVALLYNFTKIKTSDLFNSLISVSHYIYVISSCIILSGIMIPVFLVWLYFKSIKGFRILGINNLQQFLNFRNFKIILLLGLLIVAIGAVLFTINFITRKLSKDNSKIENYRVPLLINKTIIYFTLILIAVGLIFFITNPTYFLFPVQTVKSTFLQLAMTTMGSHLNSFNRPVFDPAALKWFAMLFDNNLLNLWFGLLFIVYLLYEMLNFRKNWQANREFVVERIVIWVFALFLLTVMFICVSHRPHHYLLPIIPLIGIFIPYGISEIIKKTKLKSLRLFLIVIFSAFLCLGFYSRAQKIIRFYLDRKQWNNISEPGIAIGKWLESEFPQNTSIWKDSEDFYIPPKFTRVFFITQNDDITANFFKISKLNPDVLVITSFLDPELGSARKISRAIKEGVLPGYKLIRVFKYSGPLGLGNSAHGAYKEIYIYSKINQGY